MEYVNKPIRFNAVAPGGRLGHRGQRLNPLEHRLGIGEQVARGDQFAQHHLEPQLVDLVDDDEPHFVVAEFGGAGGASAGEPAQYIDLSEWQNELLSAADTRPGREHWRRRGTTAPPPPELPLRAASRADGANAAPFQPRSVAVALPPAAWGELRALAGREQTDLRSLLLAAWALLLARLTGEKLPTTYHLLRTLVHEGYLSRRDGGYVLGERVSSLSARLRAPSLRERVRPALTGLHETLRAASYAFSI